MKLPVALDLETGAIKNRPEYPPRPVGLAVKFPGKASYYLGWGHPDSTTPENFNKAKELLAQLYASKEQILFWNAGFDLEVIEKHFGLPILHWKRVEDGLFLAFLQDPHAPSLALKPTAERLLGEAPDEQGAVRDWLISQKVVKRNQKDWGAHISEAPEKLVAKYARADVEKTAALFKLLFPKIKESKMDAAYNRERELQPILLRNEQVGLRVDLQRLIKDEDLYRKEQERAEKWLQKSLKTPDLNLDAGQDVADALDRAGQIKQWVYTEPTSAHPEGVRSTAKGNLKPAQFKDQRIASVMGYRARLAKLRSTFIVPWIEQASATGGVICPKWNQTRNPDNKGTRTGRPSVSKPNLLNVAKNLEEKDDGYEHPAFLKLAPLPVIRKYLLPDEGCVLLHRDYNQQEVRVAAHFEDGKLAAAYAEDASMDAHEFTKQEIERVSGVKISRRNAKTLNLGLMYGMGKDKLADQLGVDATTAYTIMAAHRSALRGLFDLADELKRCGRKGEPIRTWGGRLYLPEPPKNGRTFEYKLLNLICQGSAADITKQALINYSRVALHGRLYTTVYDEVNVSVPIEHTHSEMALLKEAMESVPLDVFLKTDAKFGPSWGDLKEYKDDIRSNKAA